MKKWFLLFAGLFLVASIVGVAISTSSNVPSAVMPDPNGYDTLTEAARIHQIRANDYGMDVNDLEGEALEKYVNDNEDVFALIEKALTQESLVPLYKENDSVSSHLSVLSGLKGLALLLDAKGKVAIKKGGHSIAVSTYMDAIRLGSHVSRGGIMIGRLVGIHGESIGLRGLQLMRELLSSMDCRSVVQGLRMIIDQTESVEDHLRYERIWTRQNLDLKMNIVGAALRLWPNSQLKLAEAAFEQKLAAHAIAMNDAMISFAERAYELERGEKPGRLEDLVPEYLKALPEAHSPRSDFDQ